MSNASKRLEGKVAIVTGASRGLGRATAIELGAEGATVYVTARSLDAPTGPVPGTAQETAAAVDAAGGHGIAVRCDHHDDDQVARVFEQIAADHGRLDVLVNSVFPSPDVLSAVGPGWGGAPFWELPADAWDGLFTVAVRGQYVAAQKAMPMLLQSDGLIVNISSAGAVNYFLSPLYGAGKAAGHRLMLDMAQELLEYPVSIMAVWPGVVRTELIGDLLFEQDGAMMRCLLRDAWAQFPSVAEDVAALDVQAMRELTETPHFPGRAIAALACDPDIAEKHGQALPVALLAEEYGFTDVDGRRPDAFRFHDAAGWQVLA